MWQTKHVLRVWDSKGKWGNVQVEKDGSQPCTAAGRRPPRLCPRQTECNLTQFTASTHCAHICDERWSCLMSASQKKDVENMLPSAHAHNFVQGVSNDSGTF